MPYTHLRCLSAILALTLIGCNAAPSPSPMPENRGVTSGTERRASGDTNSYSDAQPRGEFPHSRSRHSNNTTTAKPGDFDFYLLNLSWSPEFCATHSSSPECGAHLGFVVHGLWPQNSDGTYPEHCSDATGPSNPSSLTDLIPTTSLVEHEWTTHGTCSGLAADAYFAAIRRAFQEIHIPSAFTGNQQPGMLSPDAIVAQFSAANPSFPAASFALSCGNNYLTAVEVCLDKSLHPEACEHVRSCRANAVKITPR